MGRAGMGGLECTSPAGSPQQHHYLERSQRGTFFFPDEEGVETRKARELVVGRRRETLRCVALRMRLHDIFVRGPSRRQSSRVRDDFSDARA